MYSVKLKGLAHSLDHNRAKVRVGLACVLCALAGGVLWLQHGRFEVSTDDAQVDAPIVAVAPKVAGQVLEVPVSSNREIKAGQVLMRIDPAEYQIAVAKARAELATWLSKARAADVREHLTRDTVSSGLLSASASLNAAKSEYQQTTGVYEEARGPRVRYARATVATLQAVYDRARADLVRMRELVEKGEVSAIDFDRYVADARIAESELAAAKSEAAAAEMNADIEGASAKGAASRVEEASAQLAQSRAAQKEVSIRAAELASALAGVKEARARVRASELELSYTTVTAPIDGIVTRKTVEVGEYLRPGQQVMVLVAARGAFVTANFRESQLERVRSGQAAQISIDMYGRTFRGRVDSLSSATEGRFMLLPPENAVGNFVKVTQKIPVKVVFDPVPNDGTIVPPAISWTV